MSRGRGDSQSPLIGVGLAIALLLFAGGPLNDLRFCRGDDCPLAEHEQPGEAPEGERAEPAKSAEQWAAETCAIAAQANGRSSEEQVQRDLCAQFRSAAAAERSAVFAQEQSFIGWLTFGGLIATIVIAAMAWLAARSSANADNEALKLTRKQLDEAREETERQAIRTDRQIAAAEYAASSSRTAAMVTRRVGEVQNKATIEANRNFVESSQRELRAYLHISQMIISNFAVGQKVKVEFLLTNRGQTPARHVEVFAWFEYGADPHKSPVKIPKNLVPALWDIGPGEPKQNSLDRRHDLTQADLDAITSGTRVMIVAVIVRYRDVFNKRHWTMARAFLKPNALRTGRGPLALANKNNRGN